MRLVRALLALAALAAAGAASVAGCTARPTYVPDGTGGGAGASSSAGGSSAGACKIAGDCSGNDNECQHRACVAGRCVLDVAPEGTLVASQVDGDCKRAVCDGKGRVQTVEDPSDTPNDANPCTIDKCVGGKPVHDPADASMACGATGSLHCDGKGKCTGCMADAECGASTPCASYQCKAQSCEVTYVPDGQGMPGGDVKGDCHKPVCNGKGGASQIIDDTDLPDDGNPCTTGACSMGAPSESSSPKGTSCGGNATCDGAGTCQGCKANTDCGTSTPCATYTCVNGGCQNSFVPQGQGSPGGDVAGDCHHPACDGAGGVYQKVDDSDVPVDGNACTADKCANGVPSNPALAQGTPCGNLHCDGNGACTGCTQPSDCGANTACAFWVCSSSFCSQQDVPYGGGSFAQTPGDCHKVACDGNGNQANLVDDSDTPSDGNPCTADQCNGGVAYFPALPPETGCPGGVCNGGGACVQCVSDNDCGASNPPCLQNSCVSNACQQSFGGYGLQTPGQTPGDCMVNICNGGGGVISVPDNTDPPQPMNICYTTSCSNGMGMQNPVPVDDGNPCTNDACDPAMGGVYHTNVPDGTTCGPCDACYSGLCQNLGC